MNDADHSEEDLYREDFSGESFRYVNFSRAVLNKTDFTNSDLLGADFSNADLLGTDFTGANLFGTTFSGANIGRHTKIDPPLDELKQDYKTSVDEFEEARMWGAIARLNGELKTVHTENGLIGKARKFYIQERRARRREAKSDGGLMGYVSWLGSLLSRVLTGYGVQLRWVVSIMALIFTISSVVYFSSGMGVKDSLYYSIVTFTTAPPFQPQNGLIIEITAMVETFLGTLYIVLLGYVLGQREQV